MKKLRLGKVIWLPSLVFLLLSSLALNFFLYQKSKNLSDGLKVVKIIDGDTFVLDGGQRVKLADLNAPEPTFCKGKEAKERLEELILGKRVILKEPFLERFHRTMALVYQDSKLINKVLLEEGLARYDSSKTSRGDELRAASAKAKKEKRNIWSAECYQTENSQNPGCLIKGNIDKHYREKIYHFPGCSGYPQVIVEKDRGERWFCTEAAAQAAGFTKSKNCFGKKYPL